MSSNKLKELVENIRFYKKMTVEEIAASIGYSRVHLQKEMGKGDNPDLIRLLQEKYPEMQQEVSKDYTASSGMNGHNLPVQDKYIHLLEESLREKKDRVKELETRLNDLEGRQRDFLAKVEGSIERYEHLVLAQLQNHSQDQVKPGSTPTVLQQVYKKGDKAQKKSS